MTAKEFLLQVPKAEKKISQKVEAIERYKEMAKGLGFSGNGERVMTTKKGDKMETAILNYIQLQEEASEEIKELEATRNEVLKVAEKLSPELFDVISLRHFKNRTWKEIAGDLDISVGTAISRHGTALEKINIELSRGNYEKEHTKMQKL